MSSVKLVTITPDCENLIAYCARVSNPKNQNNTETAPKLISYLIKNKHWSPFELGNLVLEIKTSRGVATQILRHRSFTFQEYSQRYSEVNGSEIYEARRQDLKNRQNSVDDLSEDDKIWFKNSQEYVWDLSKQLYNQALKRGIAKECARGLLPLNTSTTLMMNGTIRSWLHYVELRSDVSTQKEHRDIALAVKEILIQQVPNVCKGMGWL